MCIPRWPRLLASLPLVWLGRIVGWVRPDLAARLYGVAWILGDNVDGAVRAIESVLRSKGPAAAIGLAREWIRWRPCAPVAAMAGLIAVQQNKLALAAGLLAEAKDGGPDRSGMVDMLEWLIESRPNIPSSAPNASELAAAHRRRTYELARRMESRRDLSPQLSRTVHLALLWGDLEGHRFDEARRRAKRMLQIEEEPQAEIVLWVLATRDGDDRRAAEHLQRAALEPVERMLLQVAACQAIGRQDEADDLLAQIDRLRSAQAQAVSLEAAGAREAGNQ